jgi:hypothetical protein
MSAAGGSNIRDGALGVNLLEIVSQRFIELRMAYLAKHFCKYLCRVAVRGGFVIFFGMFFAFRLEL